MEEINVFAEISLIIAIGTLIAFILRILKQPLIIGHIITGVIVGPAVLGVIHSEELFSVFSTLGITLLLFIIGLGLNPKVIKDVGKVAFLAGTIQIGFTTLFGYLVSIGLGYDSRTAALIGVALAFSSTIIILKLISDKKEQTRLYAKLSIGILLVQDIVATIALLILATRDQESLQSGDVALLVGKGVLLFAFLWFMGGWLLPKISKLISSSQEFLFLFALSWGLGVASLFEVAGFSIEVGALFAGVALSTQQYTSEVSAKLRPLRDFFIVVFFITLGSELVLDNLYSVMVPALVLSALVIFLNPIVIYLTLGLLGYTKRTSFKTAVGMAQISEFSLVFAILAVSIGLLSQEDLSMLTLVALITIAVSTYMIIYADKLFEFMDDRLKLFESNKVKFEQEQAGSYPILMFGYKKGGPEFVKVFRSMKKKFVVVDYDPDVIDILESQRLNYLYGDANDLELLEEVNLEKTQLAVSTITEHETNLYLVTHIHSVNDKTVIICHSDSAQHARELYEHGASYVMMSHSIGSEKIGSFLKKNGFKKTEFKKFKERHLAQLENQISAQTQKAEAPSTKFVL